MNKFIFLLLLFLFGCDVKEDIPRLDIIGKTDNSNLLAVVYLPMHLCHTCVDKIFELKDVNDRELIIVPLNEVSARDVKIKYNISDNSNVVIPSKKDQLKLNFDLSYMYFFTKENNQWNLKKVNSLNFMSEYEYLLSILGDNNN